MPHIEDEVHPSAMRDVTVDVPTDAPPGAVAHFALDLRHRGQVTKGLVLRLPLDVPKGGEVVTTVRFTEVSVEPDGG